MSHPTHFFDLTPDTFTEWCAARSLPAFRAKQILQWVYEKRVTDPHLMTNLAAADRELLARDMTFTRWRPITQQDASDGTRKLLLTHHPGPDRNSKTETECVMIPATSQDSGRQRRTACISSQVGCPVGCTFCASGLGGLDANLTTGLIVEQVYQLNQHLASPHNPNTDITNIVFMGMGEPLSNYAHVIPAIQTLTAPWAFNLSARRITLSTVGLPAQIRRLADQLNLPITLAISLHAPNDELRRQLIPWAEYTSIEQLIDAARYYFDKTKREVTFEYILIHNTNDQPQHAKQLASLATTLRANVNLIRYNEVASLPFQRPDSDNVHAFQSILKSAGVNTHIRASRGRDIAAACGQLRHESAPSPR